ncbi:hypothetical protein TCE0_033r09567 [Talaromyces pinophilus]|uniref:Uncharacterized protein n=1 Tax=Talaromyces pinophilus TaxID=128442 RepID=A0A6V8HBT8_TALPI|nr:hypothetical protein TCE0_033r09567 [Talaromyces pinophilus]
MGSVVGWQFGGDGGNPFDCHRESGQCPLVSKIEVWFRPKDKSYPEGVMKAIQMIYHDGYQSPVYGSIDGQSAYESLDLAFGETLLAGIMWLPYDMKRCGGFDLVTNKGQQCLGFWYIEDLKSMDFTMSYLSFPNPNDITTIDYSELIVDNTGSDQPLVATVSRSETVTHTTSHTEEWSETMGISTKFDINFFKLVKVETTIKFEATHRSSDTDTHSEAVTLSWSGKVTVPPREEYIIDLTYSQGTFKIDSEATVTFQCKNGSSLVWIKPGACTGAASGIATLRSRKNTGLGLTVKRIEPTKNILL